MWKVKAEPGHRSSLVAPSRAKEIGCKFRSVVMSSARDYQLRINDTRSVRALRYQSLGRQLQRRSPTKWEAALLLARSPLECAGDSERVSVSICDHFVLGTTGEMGIIGRLSALACPLSLDEWAARIQSVANYDRATSNINKLVACCLFARVCLCFF